MEKRYDKLVRDHIPQIIREQGNTPVTRQLGEDEYRQALIQKLQEEVAEFVADNSLGELCDILEVVAALTSALGVSHEALQKAKDEKAARNGAFRERVFLESVITAE